jgi:hypothetical protein
MKDHQLYQDAEALMKIWIREMRQILEDPEKRSASDFANALKFFKDHSIILDPIVPEAPQVTLTEPEDLPSFLKDDFHA